MLQGRRVAGIVFVLGVLFLVVLQFVMDPVRQAKDPVAVANNFIGYVELQQFDKASQFLSSSFRNSGQADHVLRQLWQNLDQNAVNVKLVSNTGSEARVQFYNDPNAVLVLTKEGDRWVVSN
ncbi:hypothetical protein CVV65_06830 [Kyrpidia spormannii]|uniref:DUF4878 domain-containing protein n=2 Tax=Kyrpidia spormannii TaxID=2055160 RepID=A0A2K8N5R5_9BACL|nr:MULTISPECIES: hypothetical protein [Kyrpidia]HHY68211.1 hypothetical protein [Alicyclobacillus sp.]ATY84684.1 hypothetical protein CVV65_06830 [Kyrpidia spormannii]MCL6577483.1 hypothetical protein [Kyrpidia sp.]CAB3391619.1 conserved exported protein of unknown function [Kyrpidia spormannii]CAB3392531.1 conserved exported protein of unknown function [Kyrpidia spormannii]